MPPDHIRRIGFSTLSSGKNINGGPIVDIVFVHGLGGHPKDTWSTANPKAEAKGGFFSLLKHQSDAGSSSSPADLAGDGTVFWPSDLLPQTIKNARIMTYGYDSDPLVVWSAVNRTNVFQHAKDFLIALTAQRRDNPSRPIIIVAHSLGGILVKDALKQSKDAKYTPDLLHVYKATQGLIFMGVPHRGSNWVSMARNLSALALGRADHQVLNALDVNSETLGRLMADFAILLKEETFGIHTFQETKEIVGIPGLKGLIVEPFSCIIGDACEQIQTLNGNHRSMCKYNGAEDDNYNKVYEAISGYVRKIEVAIHVRPDPLAGPEVNLWGSLPRLVPYFTGRFDILKEMDSHFQSTRTLEEGQKTVVLHGIGGVGKSATALKYAMENRTRYTCVLWIDASSKRNAMCSYHENTLLILARDKHLPHELEGLAKENEVMFVREWITRRKGRWLLIFDGLDDPTQGFDLDWSLPQSGVGDIIITSRQKTAENCGHGIAVGEMKREEAITLLLSLTKQSQINTDHRDQAGKIADYLGCLALGLELAGSYICHALRGDLDKYMMWGASEPEEFYQNLSKDNPKSRFLSSYNVGVFETWRRSLKEVGREAEQFLHLCGFFDRSDLSITLFRNATRTKYHWNNDGALTLLHPEDVGIPAWLLALTRRSDGSWNEFEFGAVLSKLDNYSFLRTPKEDSDKLWIHPLVHEWAKQDLESADKCRFSMDSIWMLLQSLNDCAEEADNDLSATDRSAVRDICRTDMKELSLNTASRIVGNLAGMVDPVRAVCRSGQFQTGAGGIVDRLADLLYLLQTFRTHLDRAYCAELDPRAQQQEILQFDFYDTFATLIAFQYEKFRHSSIKDASGIFFNAKSLCRGTSTYASALLLSYLVVRDAWHWDKLLEWSSVVERLIQEQQMLRNPGKGVLMLAACTQLAMSFSYAIGRNHQNNTNPFSDPMNFADDQRHQAIEVLSSIGLMLRKCHHLLNIQVDGTKGKRPASKLELSTTLMWQLKLSLGWHCLREGRIDECAPLFKDALAEIRVLKDDGFVSMVQNGIEHGVQVNRRLSKLRVVNRDMLSDRDFLSYLHSNIPKELAPTPPDLRKLFPDLPIKRTKRRKIQSEIVDDDLSIRKAPTDVLAETRIIVGIDRDTTSDVSGDLFVKTLTGKTVAFHFQDLQTVNDLKSALQDREGVPPDQQRIIFNGKQLEDGYALHDYNIQPGCSVHLVMRHRGA